MNAQACAPSHTEVDWYSIDWAKCQRQVKRLQARILKAQQAKKTGKVKALQWLLTHSFSAKALAVKRVTENKGKTTAGVDGETWATPEAKAQAIHSLKRHGYKAKPLKRIYIPKTNGKRPLSIPCMLDRAMQSLYLLALQPLAEAQADKNSYGFRPERSPADAVEQCFLSLSRKTSAQWILEGDIRACFDRASHIWIAANIPTDKVLLKKWLKAGFMEAKTLYPTDTGLAQGSPISPTIMNMVLDGLEPLLMSKFKYRELDGKKLNQKLNVIRFADDFCVTGYSKAFLENEVKPLIETFLAPRGLELSQEKTRITHINEGFDFLGQHFRKYKGKLLIQPSKKNLWSFLDKVRQCIKHHRSSSQLSLIKQLNPIISGWANYHRHIAAKKTFSKVDNFIWNWLWRWAKRRHPMKSPYWVYAKYYKPQAHRTWVFACDDDQLLANGKPKRVVLRRATDTPIRRHLKIKAEANPFDPAWNVYFEKRLAYKMKSSLWGRKKLLSLWTKQTGHCPHCRQLISQETSWHVHHLLPKSQGGDDRASNLTMMHPSCHRQLHSQNLKLVELASARRL